jgi:hypothetical protein
MPKGNKTPAEYVLSSGWHYLVVRLPAERPEDELLNLAAVANDFKWPLPTVSRWQREGWPANGGKKLRQEWHTVSNSQGRPVKMRFVRRGDVVAAIRAAAPEPGDTAERFRLEGKWRRTKTSLAQKIGRPCNGDFDRLCAKHGVRFKRVRSPISGWQVTTCLDDQAKEMCDRLVSNSDPPPINGEPAVFLVEVARRIRMLKVRWKKQEGGKRAPRPNTSTLRRWEAFCIYLEGPLRIQREEGGHQRPYCLESDADRILAGIGAELQGNVDEGRKALTKAETERKFAIRRHTLHAADRGDVIKPVAAPKKRSSGVSRGSLFPVEGLAAIAGALKTRRTHSPERAAWQPPLGYEDRRQLMKRAVPPNLASRFYYWNVVRTAFSEAVSMGTIATVKAPLWGKVFYEVAPFERLLAQIGSATQIEKRPPNYDRDEGWHRQWLGGKKFGPIRDSHRARYPHDLEPGERGYDVVRKAIEAFERRLREKSRKSQKRA